MIAYVTLFFEDDKIDWYDNGFYIDHGWDLDDLIDEMFNHNSSMVMDFLFG